MPATYINHVRIYSVYVRILRDLGAIDSSSQEQQQHETFLGFVLWISIHSISLQRLSPPK